MNNALLNEVRSCVRYLKNEDVFCLDLETTGLNPLEDRIRGIAIGTDKKQWYLQTVGKDALPLIKFKKELAPVLLDISKVCVMHNGKFDLRFLDANDWELNCKTADTMVCAYLLDDNRSGTGRLSLKGKGGLIDELFDIVLETWEESELAGGLFGKPEDVYAKQDVEFTMKCWKKLTRQLASYPDIKRFFWEVAMPMVRILADIENTGMRVDTEYLRRYENVVTQEAGDIEKRIADIVGKSINLGSPDQLSRFLFEEENGPKLQPKPWMKRGKKGLFSTSESVLSRYSQESPVCQMILDWRAKNKLVSTYISPFLRRAETNPERRIHGSLLQCNTKTGRLASRDPNLQNIPQYKGGDWGMRKAFVAPPGKKLIVADYSQLELRIMAHQSRDKTMTEIYQSGGDIHQTTQDALGLGPKDRTVAKGANFGIIYGLSAQGFKDDLWNKARVLKTLEECQQWRYAFFKTYPGIKLYHEKIERFMKKHGYTLTLAGRRRRVKEEMDRDYGYAFRMALNSTIQGSAADIVMIAMRNFDRSLRKFREKDKRWEEVKMLLQVHDEIIVESPEEIANDVAAVLQKDMENATTLRVPLEAGPGIGDSWAEAK